MNHDFSTNRQASLQAPLRVGLIGLGTVGRGTYQVLKRNADLLFAKTGRRIQVDLVAVRDTGRAQAILGSDDMRLVTDPFEVVRDVDIDVVVEAIGGTTLAKDLALEAIANDKHLVTANKALLAEHGREIFAKAQARGVVVAYEGAVAVSIPIIKALREGLVANRIEWVAGIINGTSNFILSQMRLEGVSFADALADAQQRGFAELDPRFDVEGIDAAHKLTLLASNAFGIHPQFAQVHVEGIAQLESVDFDYAQALGYSIKLLGIGKRLTQGVERQALELRVHPTLIAADHLLAHVNDSMNAVMVKSDAAGVTMVYGAGAGSEETASAVIADLVDIARVKDLAHHHRVPYLGFQAKQMRDVPIIPIEDVQTQHYLRINTHKAFETLALVQGCFAKLGMEIQEEKVFATLGVPAQEAIVFIVKHCKDKRVASLTKQIERLPNVVGRVTHIRVEALE